MGMENDSPTGMGTGMGMRLINGDGDGLAVSGPGAGAIGCSTKLRVCLVGRNEMSDEWNNRRNGINSGM
ncbi:hypothetical protein Tco_0762969 [Tanacetum coccineum]